MTLWQKGSNQEASLFLHNSKSANMGNAITKNKVMVRTISPLCQGVVFKRVTPWPTPAQHRLVNPFSPLIGGDKNTAYDPAQGIIKLPATGSCPQPPGNCRPNRFLHQI